MPTAPLLRQTISCKAAYGQGGMGQHFAQVVEAVRAEDALAGYYSGSALRPGDEGLAQVVSAGWVQPVLKLPPLRFSKAWRTYVDSVAFDRAVAAALPAQVSPVVGAFAGEARDTLRRARDCGAEQLALHAATCHIAATHRQNQAAYHRHPLERPWLNQAFVHRILQEYALADVIHVNSAYTWQTFVDEGVPEAKLQRFHLRPKDRFGPPATRPDDGVFRVVTVGNLAVTKGIPVLIEAFMRLEGAAELTLLGGPSSRGMRRYLAQSQARDPRIRLPGRGDPAPHLHRADVYAHPTYQDGFGYAPMEALACGVPVVVTDATGMKEHVQEGVNGYIVPTGDSNALYERLVHLRRHPLAQSQSLVHDPV